MKIVDARTFLSENLRRNLERVINSQQHRDETYWLLVFVDDKYLGPPGNPEQTRTINLQNKRIIHNTIMVMDYKPPVPFLSTMLWEVSNKKGRARLLYVLPADKPIIDCEDGEGTEIVFNSLRNTKVPLHYYRN